MSAGRIAACMLLAGDRIGGSTVIRIERAPGRRGRKVRIVFAAGSHREPIEIERETILSVDRPASHCDGCRDGGPSHFGSPRCESGSLASGGATAHCSCSTCF